MARLLKCYGWCDEKHLKEDLIMYKNKNYCAKCLERKEYDDVGRVKLKEQIKKSYGIDYPTGFMLKQSKKFREEQGYTYQNQAKAIWFADTVQHKEMDEKYGLGIIPFVINQAIIYYDDQKEKAAKMKDGVKTGKTKTIKIKKPFYNEAKSKRLIDMESLLNE